MKSKREIVEEKFRELREDWNALNSRTIQEIRDILSQDPKKKKKLNNVSLSVKGCYETYNETFTKIELVGDDLILTSDEGDEYDVETDLSLGSSLWLYYNMA